MPLSDKILKLTLKSIIRRDQMPQHHQPVIQNTVINMIYDLHAKQTYDLRPSRFRCIVPKDHTYLSLLSGLMSFKRNSPFRAITGQPYVQLNRIFDFLHQEPRNQCEKCLNFFPKPNKLVKHRQKSKGQCKNLNFVEAKMPHLMLMVSADSFACNLGCDIISQEWKAVAKHMFEKHTSNEL